MEQNPLVSWLFKTRHLVPGDEPIIAKRALELVKAKAGHDEGLVGLDSHHSESTEDQDARKEECTRLLRKP